MAKYLDESGLAYYHKSLLSSLKPGWVKYSNEEHVVGEWIDGTPVYERTFTLYNVDTTVNYTYILDSTLNKTNCIIGDSNIVLNGVVVDGMTSSVSSVRAIACVSLSTNSMFFSHTTLTSRKGIVNESNSYGGPYELGTGVITVRYVKINSHSGGGDI